MVRHVLLLFILWNAPVWAAAPDTSPTESPASSGSLSVSVKPARGSISPAKPGRLLVTYIATGKDNITVTSTSGAFLLPSGKRIETNRKPVAMSIVNNSGAVAESLAIPSQVAALALEAGYDHVIYRRRFNNTITTDIILQIGDGAAGSLKVTRLTLRFRNTRTGNTSRTPTVDLNSNTIVAKADVQYTGAGMLRARWKVDDQILEYHSCFLKAGADHVAIESPAIPQLPTYDTGRHQVQLEILSPRPAFSGPVAAYVVSGQRKGSSGGGIRLSSPSNGAHVPMPAGRADDPVFQWKPNAAGNIFQFELYPEDHHPNTAPLIKALTDKGMYKLPSSDANKLVSDRTYKWRVKIIAKGSPVAASLFRSVSFVKKAKGRLHFEQLEIFETSGKSDVQQPPMNPPATHKKGNLPQFSVRMGQSITMQIQLKNKSNLTKQDIRVAFLVDDRVVDASIVSMLEPGQSARVAGRYTIMDSNPHTLKIQAAEGNSANAPVLAFAGGRLINPSGSRITNKNLKEDELQIGHFIIRLSEVTDNTPMNFSGSGTITLPFLNNRTLSVTFKHLRVKDDMVVHGNIPVNLQEMGFSPLQIGPSELTLNTLTFGPDGAVCSGSLELVFPFAAPNIRERKLTFDPVNLSIHPDKGFSGYLPLLQEHTLKLSEAFGGGDITLAEGSFITLTDNVFSSSLSGHAKLPETILATKEESNIPFTGFQFESDGGIYGNVSLDGRKLAGTDFTLMGGIVLDFTTTASPGNFKDDPDWMGIYVEDGTLDVVLFNDHFQINARHLYIHHGVNGFLSSPLEKNITAGAPKQFLYRPYNVELSFRHFTKNSGTMNGRISGIITVPYVYLSAETNQIISVAGIEPAMTLTKAVPLTLADNVSMNVMKNSTIGFADGVFTARLVSEITGLGNLGSDPGQNLWATLVLDSNGQCALEDPDGRFNTWVGTRNLQTRLCGLFSLGLEKLGFGTLDDELFFGVQGNLCLMKGFDSDPEAKIRVIIPKGNIRADNIHVGFNQPETFNFSGFVNLNGDVLWEKAFKGDMALSVADTFSTPARLVVGHTGDFPYFHIGSNAPIPSPGIELAPYPVSLYGFNGRAYFNALPVSSPEYPDGYKPQHGSTGLNGLMTVGTTFDNGYMFYGNLNLNITVDETPRKSSDISLRGDAYMMCNPKMLRDSRKGYADVDFRCVKNDTCAFTGRINMQDYPILDPASSLMSVASEIDMKLGCNESYLNMKTGKHSASMQVLPSYLDVKADGFITIQANNAESGLSVEMDTAAQTVFPIYNRLRGRLIGDFTVGFDPAVVSAEFPIWMKLSAGLSPDGSNIHEIFQTYADLFGGVQTPKPTRLQVNGTLEYPVLGGDSSGKWPVSFAWGDPLNLMYDPSAIWPCIANVTPEYGAEGVSVAAPVTVTLTQPAGDQHQLTCEDPSGRLYRVGIFVDNMVINTSAVNLSNPVPGHIEWHKDGTQFTFYPDGYLNQNTMYYVHIEAHAKGTPELIPGGKWIDRYTTKFITGAFPKELKPLIKKVYPANGQQHCYTRYPIKVNFKKPMNILRSKHLKGRLFRIDGTEIAGTHDVSRPVPDTVTFTPSGPLSPDTRYIYKLMLTPSPSRQKSGSNAETGTRPAQSFNTANAMSNILLTLSFNTGKYATFKQMIDASEIALQVDPLFYPSYEVITEEGYKPSILRCTFNTINPVRWEDIIIEAEPVNNAPTACGRLTPGFFPQDPSCRIPEKVVNRCLTRSAEEKFIHVNKIAGQTQSLSHTFDLTIQLRDYRVVPDSRDGRCSIDACNKKVADRSFIISMKNHMIGNTLHQALFDRSKIVFRHRMSPAVPYAITIDLPEPPHEADDERDARGFDIKADKTSAFQAAGDNGRVILRWTRPKNSLAAPDYKIYRREIETASWQLLTPQPISTVHTIEKAEEVLGPEMTENYAPLLFPENPDPQQNPSDFISLVQHINERRDITMLTADIYPEIADLLGVRYVDLNVKNGKTYTYRLTMIKNNKEITTGISDPVTPGEKSIAPPRGFKGKTRDSAVLHCWEVEPAFSAYDLYRSNHLKGTYAKVNTTPIVIVSTRDKDGNTQYPGWFYADNNLKNGKTYYYALQGRDLFGRKSGFTEPVALIPMDITPPKPPLKFNADVQTNTVTLTWQKNEEQDLAGYNIYRSMDYRSGFDKVNTSRISKNADTYVNEPLPGSRNWWYYATAVDKDGNESSRSYTALAYVRDAIPPVPPEGLTGKTGPGSVLLSWQPGTEKDLRGYRIYQSMKKNADYYHLLNREPVTKATYTISLPKTADANPYFYKITAVDTADNESAFSNIVEMQLPDITPPRPPVFKTVDVQEGKIILSWHTNTETDIAGYNLYRNENKHPENKAIQLNEKQLSKNTATFTDTFNLISETRYAYTLEAVDISGNHSRRSRALTAASYDETPPSPPKDVKTRPMGGGILQVSWKQPGDEDLKGVVVFRAETEDGPFYPVTAMLKDTIFQDTDVRQGKTYYYRLSAFDRSSNRSDYSKIVEGIIKKKTGE